MFLIVFLTVLLTIFLIMFLSVLHAVPHSILLSNPHNVPHHVAHCSPCEKAREISIHCTKSFLIDSTMLWFRMDIDGTLGLFDAILKRNIAQLRLLSVLSELII